VTAFSKQEDDNPTAAHDVHSSLTFAPVAPRVRPTSSSSLSSISSSSPSAPLSSSITETKTVVGLLPATLFNEDDTHDDGSDRNKQGRKANLTPSYPRSSRTSHGRTFRPATLATIKTPGAAANKEVTTGSQQQRPQQPISSLPSFCTPQIQEGPDAATPTFVMTKYGMVHGGNGEESDHHDGSETEEVGEEEEEEGPFEPLSSSF